MTVTWERTVTEVTWESATTPGVTWSTTVSTVPGGTFDGVHNDIDGRTAAGAHPVSAITGAARKLTASIVLYLPNRTIENLNPVVDEVMWWVSYQPGHVGAGDGGAELDDWKTVTSFTWTGTWANDNNPTSVLILLPGSTNWPTIFADVTLTGFDEVQVFGGELVAVGCGGASLGNHAVWVGSNDWNEWTGSIDPNQLATSFRATGTDASMVEVGNDATGWQSLRQWIDENTPTPEFDAENLSILFGPTDQGTIDSTLDAAKGAVPEGTTALAVLTDRLTAYIYTRNATPSGDAGPHWVQGSNLVVAGNLGKRYHFRFDIADGGSPASGYYAVVSDGAGGVVFLTPFITTGITDINDFLARWWPNTMGTGSPTVPHLHRSKFITYDPDFPTDGSATHIGGHLIPPGDAQRVLILDDSNSKGGFWDSDVETAWVRPTGGLGSLLPAEVANYDLVSFTGTVWGDEAVVRLYGDPVNGGIDTIFGGHPVTHDFHATLIATTLVGTTLTVLEADGTTTSVDVADVPNLSAVLVLSNLTLVSIDDGVVKQTEDFTRAPGYWVAFGIESGTIGAATVVATTGTGEWSALSGAGTTGSNTLDVVNLGTGGTHTLTAPGAYLISEGGTVTLPSAAANLGAELALQSSEPGTVTINAYTGERVQRGYGADGFGATSFTIPGDVMIVWRAAADTYFGFATWVMVSYDAADLGAGDVSGPASATDGVPVLFDGTSGKLVKAGSTNTANGLVKLDGSATVPDILIPASIARDAEIAAAIDALVNSAPSGGDTLGELHNRLATIEAKFPTVLGGQDQGTQIISSTTATSLLDATVTLPALVAGDCFQFEAPFTWFNNAGALRTTTIRAKIGATTLFTVVAGGLGSSTTNRSGIIRGMIRANGNNDIDGFMEVATQLQGDPSNTAGTRGIATGTSTAEANQTAGLAFDLTDRKSVV